MRGTALTARQRKALEAIRKSLRERGMAPTHAELAQALGISNPTGVIGHLGALTRKGWIEVIVGVERGIRLLREGAPILDGAQVPTLTAKGAGALEEDGNLPRLHDFESFAREFAAPPDLFVRIDGKCLDTAGFARGDIVAVRRQPEANDGDIVLARIGPEVTLKRFQRIDAKHVELQPGSTNPEHEPIPIGPTTHDTEIVGIVVGAIVGRRRSAE